MITFGTFRSALPLQVKRWSKKEAQKIFSKPIVTEVRKAEKFWVAEDEHQNFYFLNKRRNGYCRVVIQPKLLKLKLKN